MKYLIIFVLCAGSAFAEKERGGGSLDRLLRHAGAEVEVQAKITKHHDIKHAFFFLAEKFMEEIRARRDRGQMEFQNSAGQKYTFNHLDFVKLQSALYELQRKGITIHRKIESTRGDPITFINSSAEMTLIVSQTEFEKVLNIANRELREGLGSALVGHELLSLIKIENSDRFPVSSDMAEDVLLSPILLTCLNPSMARAIPVMLDKVQKQIRYMGTSLAFPIQKMKVNLEDVSKKVSYESEAEEFTVKLTQLGEDFFLDYEQGRTLPGSTENFIISDMKRLWCKMAPPQAVQSVERRPPTDEYF